MIWWQLFLWGLPTAGLLQLVAPLLRRRKPEPAHRPDYAKIARLEVELGLVDPPKPPPAPKALNASLPLLPMFVNQTYSTPVTKAPDERCSLCFVGGPPYGHSCPFYPVCQQGKRKR